MLSLRELQVRFLDALGSGLAVGTSSAGGAGVAVAAVEVGGASHASTGAPAGVDRALLELIQGRGALDAAARLDIYAGMHRTRLVDVLREDFPRVRAVLGDDGFAAGACRYLARHPSTNPSVRHVGRQFAAFLAETVAVPAYLGDLARLEWARVEVFDAADAEPLRLLELQARPAEAWPALRLRPVPACALVESVWPLHRVWVDAEGRAGSPPPDPAREATAVRVWREGWTVSHAAMGATEASAFRALARGETFAGICAALETELGAETAAQDMGAVLMRWIEDGLLARLDAPEGAR